MTEWRNPKKIGTDFYWHETAKGDGMNVVEFYCTVEKKMVPGPGRSVRPVVDLQTKEIIRGNAAEEIVRTILRPPPNPDGSIPIHPDYFRYRRRITYDRICSQCGGLMHCLPPKEIEPSEPLLSDPVTLT